MRTLRAALLPVGAVIILGMLSCESYVDKHQFDETQSKLKQTEEKLQAAQKELAEYQAHRYSVFHEGYRTWRMDSVSGKSCIQLTVESDWKKKETKSQSCDCEDYERDHAWTQNDNVRQLFCGY